MDNLQTMVPEIYAETLKMVTLIENNFYTRVESGDIVGGFYGSEMIYATRNTDNISKMCTKGLTEWRKKVRAVTGTKKHKIDLEELGKFLETANARDKTALAFHARKAFALYFTAERILDMYIEKYGDEALHPSTYTDEEQTKLGQAFVQQEKEAREAFRVKFPNGISI